MSVTEESGSKTSEEDRDESQDGSEKRNIGRIDCRGQDIRPQHHARAAARRRIIDAAMPVGRRIPDIARLQGPKPGRQCAAREADAERARKHVRKQRQHGRAPGRLCARAVVIG